MPYRPSPLFVLSFVAAACGGGHPTVSGTSTGGSTSSSTSSSSGSTSSSSASSTSGVPGYPAAFPAPPRVVTGGGPVMTAPQLYPVFFSGDDPALITSLTDFTTTVGATPYWTTATAEYGVGAATGHPAIMIADAAPATIDDAAIQTWLAAQIAGTNGFPTPTADTIFVLYYPSGTTITFGGATSCTGFGGYHNTAAVQGQQVVYAVLPRCIAGQEPTGAASHEIIEASTDPFVNTDPAYEQVDEADLMWQFVLGGGEIGDLCVSLGNAFTLVPGYDHVVQRVWSNKSVAAGHDPCVPLPAGEVYFNAAPVLPDVAPLALAGGATVMLESVKIPVGQSRTIPVQLFSDGPHAAWDVTAVDLSPKVGTQGTLLTMSFDKTSGSNGDTLNLTITVLGAGMGNVEPFYVQSTSGTDQYVWFGTVAN